MRVVLDTNVLVSGIFWRGPPHEILLAWNRGRFDLVASAPILDEYWRVAAELGKRFKTIRIEPIIDLIAVRSQIVEPEGIVTPRCDDPDDEKFLAAALAGSARFLVTGDRSLLRVQRYRGGLVVAPAKFLTGI